MGRAADVLFFAAATLLCSLSIPLDANDRDVTIPLGSINLNALNHSRFLTALDKATAGGLRDWLAERDLLPAGASVTGDDVPRAQQVRESIRSLLNANSGAPLDKTAVASLNASARSAVMTLELNRDLGRAHMHYLSEIGGF